VSQTPGSLAARYCTDDGGYTPGRGRAESVVRLICSLTVILITGGNKGLGFEAARQLLAAGHQVWIGARDLGRGKRAADALEARFVQLDVTLDASVAAAAETLGELDVLVNNAGISGGRISPAEATADQMRTVYETNVFGPVRVLHTFIPLLEKSSAPVVVNVSSGVGSLGLASDPEGPWTAANYPVYASSKAALNMLTVRYAAAFPGMRINSVDPGFTATDFNQHRGTQTVEQGAEVIVRYALVAPDGPTGGFFDRNGVETW
jgi:NAD(P)-dependent dehydrogenase (short-subunit alcohol dehydrogenase family)